MKIYLYLSLLMTSTAFAFPSSLPSGKVLPRGAEDYLGTYDVVYYCKSAFGYLQNIKSIEITKNTDNKGNEVLTVSTPDYTMAYPFDFKNTGHVNTMGPTPTECSTENDKISVDKNSMTAEHEEGSGRNLYCAAPVKIESNRKMEIKKSKDTPNQYQVLFTVEEDINDDDSTSATVRCTLRK